MWNGWRMFIIHTLLSLPVLYVTVPLNRISHHHHWKECPPCYIYKCGKADLSIKWRLKLFLGEKWSDHYCKIPVRGISLPIKNHLSTEEEFTENLSKRALGNSSGKIQETDSGRNLTLVPKKDKEGAEF